MKQINTERIRHEVAFLMRQTLNFQQVLRKSGMAEEALHAPVMSQLFAGCQTIDAHRKDDMYLSPHEDFDQLVHLVVNGYNRMAEHMAEQAQSQSLFPFQITRRFMAQWEEIEKLQQEVIDFYHTHNPFQDESDDR